MMLYSAVQHAKDLLAGQGNAIDDAIDDVVAEVKMLHATSGIHTVCGWRSVGVSQRMDEPLWTALCNPLNATEFLPRQPPSWQRSGPSQAVELLDKIHTAAYPPGTGAQHVKGLVVTQNLAGQDNFTAR
jgi:hypothetical protein